MTKDEVRGLMNMVNAAYPSFMRNMTTEERRTQLIVWYMMLHTDSAPIVENVIKRYIATNKYPPSISDIRDGIRQQTMPSVDFLLDVLKQSSKKARMVVTEIDGQYFQSDETERIFNGLPIELQRYLGSPDELRAWKSKYNDNPIAEEKRFTERIIEIQKDIDIDRIGYDGINSADVQMIESK